MGFRAGVLVSRRPAALAGAALLLLTLGACQPGVLDPVGPVGHAERNILIDSVVIMLAIVVPTIVATFLFPWWFRASNTRARYTPNWVYSGQIELVTWGIPLLTITLLGGVAWVGAHELDPAKPLSSTTKPLEVQVVALDWKWLFIYPAQGVASVNELAIPAGAPVHFSLTSASVLNAFFVPQLGSMIYTMNGMVSDMHLQADHPGSYRGISSHYSGDGFSDMHFEVRALDKAGFDAWTAAARNGGKTLDAAGYDGLAAQSINAPVMHFGAVDPALFQKVVSHALPPGPGPEPEPHPKTSPRPPAAPMRDAAAAGAPGAPPAHRMEH